VGFWGPGVVGLGPLVVGLSLGPLVVGLSLGPLVVGLSLGPLVVGLSLGPLVVGLGSSSRTAWSGLPTNGLVGQRIERASRGPSEPCSPCLHSASATRVMSTKHARCAALSCICDVQPCFACGFVQPCRCRVHIHSRLSASVMYNPVMP
jgi:hypothetical protein